MDSECYVYRGRKCVEGLLRLGRRFIISLIKGGQMCVQTHLWRVDLPGARVLEKRDNERNLAGYRTDVGGW